MSELDRLFRYRDGAISSCVAAALRGELEVAVTLLTIAIETQGEIVRETELELAWQRALTCPSWGAV